MQTITDSPSVAAAVPAKSPVIPPPPATTSSPALQDADGVARCVLAAMLIASVVTWHLILTKGVQALRRARHSAAFWEEPNLEAVAGRIRENGVTESFSHLVHHGFTAIEQHSSGHEGAGLIHAGAPEGLLTRALKRAIDEDRDQLEFGQSFLATVASAAPFTLARSQAGLALN